MLRLLSLLALLGAWPSAAHYVELKDELVEPETFTFGLALSGKPFSYRENGELKGFEIALAQAVAAAHALELRVLRLPRDELLATLTRGEVDAVNTLGLAEFELRTVPYLILGDHAMVLRGNPFRIRTVEDLSGRTAAATAGSSGEVYASILNAELVAAGLAAMDVHTFLFPRHTHFPVSMGHAAVYFAPTRSAVSASLDPHSRTRLVEGLFRAQREVGFGLDAERNHVFHAVEHAIAALVATGKYRRLLRRYQLPAQLSAYPPGA